MNISELEFKILKKVSDDQLVSKNELIKLIEKNGESRNLVDNATRSLCEKELIDSIAPLGSLSFVVTQRGARYIKESF